MKGIENRNNAKSAANLIKNIQFIVDHWGMLKL